MAIIRFDPFGEFAAARGPWIPAVDIFETDAHDVVIKAELPDMTREDIEVTVENNTLTLKGERKMPADVKEEQFRRVERVYGAFTRSFTIIRAPTAASSAPEATRSAVCTACAPKPTRGRGEKSFWYPAVKVITSTPTNGTKVTQA